MKDDSALSKLIALVFRNLFSQPHFQSMGYEFKCNSYQIVFKEDEQAIKICDSTIQNILRTWIKQP